VASEILGLPPDTRIRSFNEDARWLLMNLPEGQVYDFIFGDAFNDLTIPYHLTTREFSSLLRTHLKPDGLLIANIIDNFETGLFLPAYARTLQEVFGRDKIALVADSKFSHMGVNTIIVAASPDDHPWKTVERTSEGRCFVHSPAELNETLRPRPAVILTDDYAPVDNLIAPIFEERFGKKRGG
jgi:spermidine synthase